MLHQPLHRRKRAGWCGADMLNGGGGFDTLVGGMGDDFFILNDLAGSGGPFSVFNYDSVIETAGAGNDTVVVTALNSPDTFGTEAYALDANIENGAVVGALAFDLIGNELNNALIGNSYANTLSR